MDGFERYLRDKTGRTCDELDMGDDTKGRLSRMMLRFLLSTNGYCSYSQEER